MTRLHGRRDNIEFFESEAVRRDLRRLNKIVEDHGVRLTVINDGINIPPGTDELNLEQKAILYGLSFAADVEHEMIKQRTLDGLRAAEEAGKRIGRPIYGFTSEDGSLRPDDDEYEQAVHAIVPKEELDWSDRKVERRIGVPRRTVPRVVNRRSIYLSDKRDDELAARARDNLDALAD